MSLFQKAQLVVKSRLHELLDREVNTPEGYRQLIRDLEESMADLRAAIDEGTGTVNGYNRDIAGFQSKITLKGSDIDLLLGDDDPTNDGAAVDLQLEVQTLEDQVATTQGLLSDQTKVIAQLNTAYGQLEGKHREMKANLNRMTLTVAATNAKSRAAAAVEAAVDATSNVDSVDSIQGALDHENDVASARFDRVIGGLQSDASPEKAVALARANAALAERRARITAAAAQDTPAGTSA
jgi:phage shock protein A